MRHLFLFAPLLLAACPGNESDEPLDSDTDGTTETDDTTGEDTDEDTEDDTETDTESPAPSLLDCTEETAPCPIGPGETLEGTAPAGGEYFLVFTQPAEGSYRVRLTADDANAAVNLSDLDAWTYACILDVVDEQAQCCQDDCDIGLFDWSTNAPAPLTEDQQVGIHVYAGPAGGAVSVAITGE